jgi:hypothetical protein
MSSPNSISTATTDVLSTSTDDLPSLLNCYDSDSDDSSFSDNEDDDFSLSSDDELDCPCCGCVVCWF